MYGHVPVMYGRGYAAEMVLRAFDQIPCYEWGADQPLQCVVRSGQIRFTSEGKPNREPWTPSDGDLDDLSDDGENVYDAEGNRIDV